MRNVLVIYGGKSYEHDISILTAIQIMGFMNGDNDRIIPCYITRGGDKFIRPFRPMCVSDYIGSVRGFKIKFGSGYVKIGGIKIDIDAALNCCHGGFGEDGALAGMLEMYNIPFTSAESYASGVCMNKALTHEAASKIGINTVKYRLVDKDYDAESIISELGPKVIVKPISLGSSIGVKTAEGSAELIAAADAALKLDRMAVAEEFVENLSEYNIALFRCRGKVVISGIERPISGKEVLDFAEKYMTDGKMSGLKREFPAAIDPELKREIEESAESIYRALELKGVVRIDYLYNKSEKKLYLNEINTVPGSLAYYLFDTEPRKLVDKLIDEAILRFNERALFKISYESNVLNTYKKGVSKLRK